MLFPLVLKQISSTLYHDGKGRRYLSREDALYPVDPLGGHFDYRIEKHQVRILSDDHRYYSPLQRNSSDNSAEKPKDIQKPQKKKNPSKTALNSFSPEQKEKGIGILEETEKLRTVLENGDCSDGGNQEAKPFNREHAQLLSALTDSG